MPRAPLPALPVDEVLPEVVAALRRAGAAVLVAPTGAGKTTRVPPAILDGGLAGAGRVVVLEPRRVAARAAARRMAEERDSRLGDEVGYHVRFERCAGPATRLLVVTEGLLVRQLIDDPLLTGVGALVFDEFHERSRDVDLALALGRAARAARPDLTLCVLSATLDPEPVAAFLGGCPIVRSAGRLHPVAVEHAPPGERRPLAAAVVDAVARLVDRVAGDILVFLPGKAEIRRAEEALRPLAARSGLDLVPLHGDLGAAAQDAALRPAAHDAALRPAAQDAALRPAAARRVVLATNVAETSVTLEGIGAVVDTGLERSLRYDPALGLDRLELGRISQASAAQRAGRAGRTGPGRCVRLYSAAEEHAFRPTREPEIRRTDLAPVVLALHAFGEPEPARFGWFEPPEPAALARAAELLRLLGALGPAGLTADGRLLATLPVHPRLGRLLVDGHRRGASAHAALAAALLGERDPLAPAGPGAGRARSESDLLDRMAAVGGAGRAEDARDAEDAAPAVDASRARLVRRAAAELAALARRCLGPPAPPAADPETALREALVAAYPDRVARRRAPGSRRALLASGRGVTLDEASAVTEAELLVCVELDAGRRGERAEARCRLASAIERAWLPAVGLTTRLEAALDEASGRVVGARRTRYLDLVIEERPADVEPAAAAELLAAFAARDLAAALPLAEPAVAGYLARVRALAAWLPELALPTYDEAAVRALLPALCAGRRSLGELRRAPLLEVLRGALTHAQATALEREAPERLTVPSGSRIRLAYAPGRPPVLAARIQELFGLTDTPRVARGRIPVLIHLLAPSGRPQQVTDDLRSFWATTYPEIRKELRARYPKHAWPEDPRTATAERRPRRR